MAYSCKHRLVTVLDMRPGPNSFKNGELPLRHKTRLFVKPLLKICKANKNLLQILDELKFWVHPGNIRITLNLTVCGLLAAFAVNEADLCDWRKKGIKPKRELIKLDIGNCFHNIRQFRGQIKAQQQLPDGCASSKDSPRLSLSVQVAEKKALPSHSQKWVSI